LIIKQINVTLSRSPKIRKRKGVRENRPVGRVLFIGSGNGKVTEKKKKKKKGN